MSKKAIYLYWSGNRKILKWNRESYHELLKQLTIDEIEIMNDYLDGEGYDLKGLCETHAEYVDNVLFTYIKDWMKLLIEEDRFEEAKEMFSIYSAVMATRSLN